MESLFHKVAGLTFVYRTPLAAASASQLAYLANQLTGFNLMETLALTGLTGNWSSYSRMGQVKFVEDSFKNFEVIWSA